MVIKTVSQHNDQIMPGFKNFPIKFSFKASLDGAGQRQAKMIKCSCVAHKPSELRRSDLRVVIMIIRALFTVFLFK